MSCGDGWTKCSRATSSTRSTFRRYLFEGRNEARLPVPLVRARWLRSEALTVEGVWVPLFRRARFDFLDEDSSPFNLLTDRDLCRDDAPCPPIPLDIAIDRREPARTLGQLARRRARECDERAGRLVGVGVSRLRVVRRRRSIDRLTSAAPPAAACA